MNVVMSASPWSVTTVRWSVSLHMLALALQLAAMLLFLSGFPQAFLVHSNNAWLVLMLGSLQLLTILACRPARGDRFYTGLAIAVAALEAIEIELGRNGLRFAHLTLAMIIWGLSLTVLIRTRTASWAPWAPK
jgi:hypothetical protein